MKRTPNRSVLLVSSKSYSNLTPFPSLGGKEFHKFLSNLPNLINENSRAIIFHLSHLNIGKQHQDYLKIIQENLQDTFKPQSGHIFSTHQGDIICIYQSSSNAIVKTIAEKIRAFFSEDVFTESSDTLDDFYKSYKLNKEYKKFSTALQEILEAQEGYLTPTIPDKWIKNATRHISALTPPKYKEICEKLAKADISKCIRAQPICKLSKNKPEIESREIYVYIAELQKIICPNVDLLTDPWLFQSLTHYLDKAVIQDLINSKIKHVPFNLNLNMNISSLMTEEFLKWDEKLEPQNRKRITIELQKMDIFADMGAYQYVRDFLQTKGYKICLDGLTHLTLPLIDWKRLKVDCIKLYWSGEMIHNATLAAITDKEDFAKIILAHCDDPQAIKWGKAHNIKLFQGWHVDQLLMPGYSQE